MPRDLKPANPQPLSETEERTLRFLLQKRAQTLPAALAQHAKEQEKERKDLEKIEAKARAEQKLSRRLMELRLDLDRATQALYQKSESGVAFRHVAGKLQEFGSWCRRLSYFNTAADNLDYDHLLLLGELALEMYQASTKPKSGGKSLRARMESVSINVGMDAPGAGGPTDDRAQSWRKE